MVSFWRCMTIALIGMSLAGCAGLTQMQDTMTKFDQSTHSVSTSETNFFRAVQAVDCTSSFYWQAIEWARGNSKNFDIVGNCKPSILTDDQIKTRQALMDAITLYADKIEALATDDNDKTLNADSQTLAGNINSIAKQHKFSDLSTAAAVEAAVIGISDMVLDQKRFTEIKKSAMAMDSYLTTVVTALKQENIIFAQGIASKIDNIDLALKPIVAAILEKQTMERFSAVVDARRILQAANPFGTTPLSQTNGAADADKDPQNLAIQLNKALDSVLIANKAIANASTGGIIASVNDLIARAQAVQSIQVSLNK